MVTSSRVFRLFLTFIFVIFFCLNLATAKAEPLGSQKQDIVSELITLKSKNSRLETEANKLDERLSKVDKHLTKLNKQIIDKEFKLNKELSILAKRAKALYKEERHHTSLQIILASQSIYEFLTRIEFFGLIIKQDIKLLKKTKIDRSRLIKLKSSYVDKRKKIVSLKQRKQQTISEVKTVRVKLRKKLKVANDREKALVSKGLNSASFYDRYLFSKKSPMTGLGPTLVTAGRTFSINPNIVIAIAGVESGFGRHNANSYNAWGRKAKGGGYEAFPSWEAAVFNQTQYLRVKYYNKGLKDLVSIGAKYAPGNTSWPPKVEHFLNDIQAFRRSSG